MNRSIFLSFSIFIIGCGTQELRPDQYIEIGRGEKALLTTTNSETFNPFDWFFDAISETLFGEEPNKRVTILSIDDKEVKYSLLYDNQDVVIPSGIHTILISCSVDFEDKKKSRIYSVSTLEYDFIGGYKYKVRFKSHTDYECLTEIIPDEKYNHSLKIDHQTAADY